jgi:alcohol dehydrogenase class IV
MEKNYWLDLCMGMLIAYIPQRLDTRKTFDKYLEIVDHFSSATKEVSNKIKIERNITEVSVDENEITKILSEMMKSLSKQSLEFLKMQRAKGLL